MRRTFASEDKRKDALWEAWEAHLKTMRETFDSGRFGAGPFDDIFEGQVHFSYIAKKSATARTESGKKLGQLVIDPQIKKLSSREDDLYIVAGKHRNKWWPLEVYSIGSIVNLEKGEVHFSFNPVLMGIDKKKSKMLSGPKEVSNPKIIH